MPFQYSSFISYRHNEMDNRYYANLIRLLKSEISKATNIKAAFFDKDEIKWGVEWDNKIFSGIENSIFFLPIWYYHYLNENDLWCAKELYHALEIEKIIKSQLDQQDRERFYFIFPLIYRGDTHLLPQCLSRRSVKSLAIYEADIKNNKVTARLQKFINEVFESFFEHYLIIDKYKDINFQVLFKNIKIPDDAEIASWVKEQKKLITQKEAEKLPILTKNEE